MSGNLSSQAFIVPSGVSLTVTNLSFINFFTAGSGGVIENFGDLTVVNCGFMANYGGNGGAIYNAPGASLSLTGGNLFEANNATFNGGAIANFGLLSVTSLHGLSTPNRFESNRALQGALFSAAVRNCKCSSPICLRTMRQARAAPSTTMQLPGLP